MLECKDGKNNKYAIDIVRGRQKPSKATYQTRYNKATVLIRVDIDGPPHDNPDGEEIPCPHIHIYREGFEDKWAYPLGKEMATNPEDLIQVLIDFLAYTNISNMHEINIQEVICLMVAKENLKNLMWIGSILRFPIKTWNRVPLRLLHLF